jgi:pimeloyl-ACP methyl ester carboxylesterase
MGRNDECGEIRARYKPRAERTKDYRVELFVMTRLRDSVESKILNAGGATKEKCAGGGPDSNPQRVDFLRMLTLGGIQQAIHVCGEDSGLPLLLFLHGGPGLPHMPFAHVNAELGKWFLVVNWDQRGAGKSYSLRMQKKSLSVEQLVSDTCELIFWLRKRFNKTQVVLVGHSWGSVLGAIVAARHPRLVAAYISIGQVTNLRSAEQMRFQFSISLAQQTGDRSASTALARLGPPPYASAHESDVLDQCACRLTGKCHRPLTEARFFRLALSSPVYSWLDLIKIPLGVRFSERCFWTELLHGIDLFSQVPRLNVPTYFLVGRHDGVVTHELVLRYFETLEAPHGKSLITFEDSGHWPHLEEPALFRAVLTGPVRRRLR